MSVSTQNESRPAPKAVIGNDKNFWLYDRQTGFDLTHPPLPTAEAIIPRVTFATTASDVTVDPTKTALVIIDMQNFFLSPAFGRSLKSAGHKAVEQVSSNAVPAARSAGIQIIWLNWGLTEEELQSMPPSLKRVFGFTIDNELGEPEAVAEQGKNTSTYRGLGSDFGKITDPDTGGEVDAGRMLMRDQWNTALYHSLDELYRQGLKVKRPDVWMHKNRMSGLWERNVFQEYLDREGIKTLLFTGVNTDQCVGGTLQDAYSKGYDCILLSDGAATSSPDFSQQCIEYNGAKSWGFVTSCSAFAKGVENAQIAQK